MKPLPVLVTLTLAIGLVLLEATGCRGRTEADLADATAIEALGEYRLDEPALDRYVRAEVGLDPAEIDPLGRARLREELLAESLFARAAEREKLAAPADALATESERLQRALGPSAAPADLARDARRRVLAREYERLVLLPRVKVDPDRAGPAFDTEPPAATGPQVVFRQLRVDTAPEAERAYRRISRGAEFEAVAAEVSTSPDRGRPQQRLLSELPPAVGDVLARAREGAVTRPTNVDGAYYVFQVDARNETAGVSQRPEELRERLMHEALDRLRQETLADLARHERVRPPVPAAPAEDR